MKSPEDKTRCFDRECTRCCLLMLFFEPGKQAEHAAEPCGAKVPGVHGDEAIAAEAQKLPPGQVWHTADELA